MQRDNKYGELIKKFRLKNNLSQEEFAFQCQMQPGHISKIERGVHKANLDTLEKIAAGFNMSLPIFLLQSEEFSKVPAIDPTTAKITGIAKRLSEEKRIQLLKIAKTFK